MARRGFLDKIGHGIQTAGKVVGIAKGLYDVGKTIYSAGQAVAPLLPAAAAVL